jgi:hypothetical protein
MPVWDPVDLQYRNRAETVARHVWRGRSYCRTKEALIRCRDEFASQIDPATRMPLAALPERINSEKQTSTSPRNSPHEIHEGIEGDDGLRVPE